LGLCISAGVASACTDVELPFKQAKRNAEMIFRGTVTAQIFSGDGIQTVAFRVSRVWKGRVLETLRIPVNPMSGCTNAFRSKVEIGSEFLIFAGKESDGHEYHVSPIAIPQTTQTKKFNNSAQAEAKINLTDYPSTPPTKPSESPLI
jgi:hypothetical protein